MLNTSLVPVSATGGYDIPNSLRFNDDDSSYLSRTPSTAGNRKTWTYSAWVKRGDLGPQRMFGAGSDNYISFGSTDTLELNLRNGGSSSNAFMITNALFRDPSAWYHIIVAMDTTQATASNRVKIYVNGEQQTSFSEATYPSQNNDLNSFNNTLAQYVGRYGGGSYFDGYLAEVNFVDGQALTPADFGETGDYGEWKPIEYEGTYGTNGFYLDFKDSGSLGNDANGSNNWTPNNLAATDQMLDSPTNNFATLNPLVTGSYITLSEGNLKSVGNTSSDNGNTRSSFAVSTGLHYTEVLYSATGYGQIGICPTEFADRPNNAAPQSGASSAGSNSVIYKANGTKENNGSSTSYGDSYTAGDIIGIALDSTNGAVYFSKNGTWQNSGVPTSGASKTGAAITWTSSIEHVISIADYNSSSTIANFGQDSSFAGNKTAQGNGGAGFDFYYTPPTGFKALCTKNLPAVAVIPSEHFNTVTYTGNGGTSRSITGAGFDPDMCWVKSRGDAENHGMGDRLRTGLLYPNLTNAETGTAYITPQTDGFLITSANNNTNAIAYASWNWKANGTGVSNTSGSITSTVSANVDAGFSIVSYTGNATSGATVGHGLSVAPDITLIKVRSQAYQWMVYTGNILATNNLVLNDTTAGANSGGTYGTFGASTLGLETNADVNGSGETYIAYAFHSVDGYSKVGSYTGNGSTDGTFVYCGFRPAYVMAKRTDTTSSHTHWIMKDSTRNSYNEVSRNLWADSSKQENDGTEYTGGMDLLSNGFKSRYGYVAGDNASGGTYIYIAFAESPFKHSNAR